MKGDLARDVSCPLWPVCDWVGHPRATVVHTQHQEERFLSDAIVERRSVYQHLSAAHPELGLRQRSILADLAMNRD